MAPIEWDHQTSNCNWIAYVWNEQLIIRRAYAKETTQIVLLYEMINDKYWSEMKGTKC